MNGVISGSLIISSDLNISEILEFDMEVKKNCHTIAYITGIVPEEIGESSVLQKLEGSRLSVSEAEENGSEKNPPIFCGFLKTVELWQEGNGCKVKLEGISATELLDREEKCRSFQNTNMTYKELVRNVLADTENTEVIFQIEDKKIGRPMYQYEETDWEFLKRMASQIGISLLPGGISIKPELYFGLPKGKKREETESIFEKTWFDKTYDQFNKKQYPCTKSQFFCHEISSYEGWKAGDSISLPNGQETTVLSVRSTLEKGLLVYHYTAASPKAFGTPQYDNPKIAGVSLAGTVLETKEECVRVKLDIDKKQPANEAFWYPWMPKTGNLMYCMPEMGERIMITFDDEEGHARGTSCIRTNGTGNGEMGDPSKRYFTTARDKRMYLMSESLGFVDLKQQVPLKVELHDTEGADIESSRQVTVLAKEGVWLKGRHISFQAPQEISIIRRDIASPTVINLCNGFDSIGKFGTVKMKGSGDVGFPVLDSSDSDQYDITGAENAVMASTPCAAGGTELERQITGTKVDIVSGR